MQPMKMATILFWNQRKIRSSSQLTLKSKHALGRCFGQWISQFSKFSKFKLRFIISFCKTWEQKKICTVHETCTYTGAGSCRIEWAFCWKVFTSNSTKKMVFKFAIRASKGISPFKQLWLHSVTHPSHLFWTPFLQYQNNFLCEILKKSCSPVAGPWQRIYWHCAYFCQHSLHEASQLVHVKSSCPVDQQLSPLAK